MSHSIVLTIAHGGMEAARWECHEREEGCIDAEAHRPEWKHSEQCLRLVFLEEGGTWDEMYSGSPAPVHSGPIELSWSGDGYDWKYAE